MSCKRFIIVSDNEKSANQKMGNCVNYVIAIFQGAVHWILFSL